jgi:hypothetical protein
LIVTIESDLVLFATLIAALALTAYAIVVDLRARRRAPLSARM